jgi:hypothetical protein
LSPFHAVPIVEELQAAQAACAEKNVVVVCGKEAADLRIIIIIIL